MTLGLIYFYLLAALTVIGALVAVFNRNPIRCAMGLLLLILSMAGLLPLKMRPIRLQPTNPALDYLPLFCDYQKSASARGVCINKSPLSEVAFIADEMRRTDFGRAHSADRKRMAAGYRAQAPAY